MRLDPRSGKVSKTIRLGGTPKRARDRRRAGVGRDRASPPQSPPADGARLTTRSDFPSLDPALGIWRSYRDVCESGDVPGQAGARGIAHRPGGRRSRPCSDCRRNDLHVQDPPRLPLLAAVERGRHRDDVQIDDRTCRQPAAGIAAGELRSAASSATTPTCTGKARGLSGIVARGRTLTITLSQTGRRLPRQSRGRRGLRRPRGTPAARGMNDIPSAGPYYVASYTPRQQLVLRRNPNYGGDRPHRLEQIVVAIGVDPARALEQVEAGTADYALELPREAGPRLESAYGPGSEAAKAGHQQYFISEALGARVLHMNTSRPLFSDVRLRRAVNYAIDRQALAAQGRRAAEINPFNAGAAHGRLRSSVRVRSRGLPSVSPGRARPPASKATRGRTARDGDHVHAEPLALARGGADRPPQPEAAGNRRRGEGVPDRRLLHARHSARRAVRPGCLRIGRLHPIQWRSWRCSRQRIGPTNISHFHDPDVQPEARRGGEAVGRGALPSRRPARARAPARRSSRRPRSRRRRAATSSRRGSGARCTSLSGAWTSARCACGRNGPNPSKNSASGVRHHP